MTEYKNPPTVVVVLIPIGTDVVAIRRNLPDGWGKLALPGGYQEEGETWQEAGAREVLEETGLIVDPNELELLDVVTVQQGKINLLFCQSPVLSHSEWLASENFSSEETIHVTRIMSARNEDFAFPTHHAIADRYFKNLAERFLELLIKESRD